MLLLQPRILILPLLIYSISGFTIKNVEDEELNRLHKTSSDETVFDQIVKNNRETFKEKEEEQHFEGDIVLVDQPEGEETSESSVSSSQLKRSLRRAQEYLWIDRVVPYEFSPEVADGSGAILEAMEDIETKTCISFKQHTNEKNWVQFVNKGDCSSSVGRSFWISGYQELSLANSCLQSKGTIMHELLHALGFWHEQSRPDRNQYVEIMWENIENNNKHNFAKYSHGVADDLGSNYDANSIMHYGKYSFSKNGKPTIVAIGDKNKELGQRRELSVEDVIQINALYKCQDVGKTYTTWSNWGPCEDITCKKTRQRFCSNYDASRCPEASIFGVHTEYSTCTKEECHKPQNGHWGRWSFWNDCSKDCGEGTKERSRECVDPEKKNGGLDCQGDSKQQEKCFIKPCGLNPDDCQFDGQVMCFWKDSSSSTAYAWQRIKGTTRTSQTGPDGDHTTSKTTKDGHYMYAEASSPASTGKKASLLSKSFRSINARCLTFFYSMHGLGIGALRLFLVTEGTGTETKIWEKTGPQGEGWKKAEVDFSSKYAYRIRFESERGATFQSDIGLDDVYFRDSKCSEEPIVKVANMSIQVNQPTDPISRKCGVAIKPLGCFTDGTSDHSLPHKLDSHWPNQPFYHGVDILWEKYPETLKNVLCDCITRAKSRNMKYIGLQNYGECWASDKPTYDRGSSSKCVDSTYVLCDGKNTQDICVGKDNTNYVYEIL